MTNNKWSANSKKHLDTLHSDLQVLCNYALKYWDCSVLDGPRGKARQNEAYKAGDSKLKFPDGKHNLSPSEAVDITTYDPGLPTYDPTGARNREFAFYLQGVADMLFVLGLMTRRVRIGHGRNPYQHNKPDSFDWDPVHCELL